MRGLLKLVVALGVEAALAAFVIVGIGLYKVIRSRNRQVDPGETHTTSGWTHGGCPVSPPRPGFRSALLEARANRHPASGAGAVNEKHVGGNRPGQRQPASEIGPKRERAIVDNQRRSEHVVQCRPRERDA